MRKKFAAMMFKNERGSVLIFFAMLLIILFATLALVVDLGYARLTQSQMQSATDSGSIFGLRVMGDSSLSAQEQRIQTSMFVRGLFDDDSVDGSSGLDSDDYQFGAGPIMTLTTGPSEILNQINVNQVETTPVYKPVLEANLENWQHGDMVVGDFGVSGDCNEAYLKNHEDLNYCRDDFSPNPTGNAFLIRMRRTDDASDLDDQVDISTTGGLLPYLLGRGSGIMAGLIQGGGISVRATSISRSDPALRVGVVAANVMGVSSFALEGAFWNSLLIPDGEYSASPISLEVRAEGTIHPEGEGGIVGGFVFGSHDESTQLSIAHELSFLTPEADTLNSSVSGIYVPLYSNINGKNLIIGFGRAQMNKVSGNFPSEVAIVTLSKLRGGRVHQNASGILRTFPAGTTNAEMNQVLLQNKNVNEQILIPVLTR